VRADLDNCYRPYVGLTGDIAQTLEALTPQLKRSKRPALSSSILQAIVAARNLLSQEAASRGGTPIHPLRIVHEMQPFLTTDLTLCLDMGSFHLWMARHLYSFRARQSLTTNGQQTLGVALPWGIAASLVRPADKIVLDEAHARHLLRTYCVYYNKTRTHLSLSKDAPDRREVHRPERRVMIVGLRILGGLHHRYERRAA